MIRFRKDRSQWTAIWLVAISCAGSGCQVLDFSATQRITNRLTFEDSIPSKKQSRTSVDRSQRSAIQTTSFEEPTDDPSSGSNGSSEAARELSISLSEAVTTALNNNMHLRVIANVSEEAGKRADMEKAQFDTVFNTNAQYMQGTQQVTSCCKRSAAVCHNTE